MIQRIQSIYLLLPVVLNAMVFYSPIYRHGFADPSMWIGYTLALSLTAAMVGSLAAIFLFRSRSLQLSVVKVVTYIQIVALGAACGVLFSLGGFGSFLLTETVSTGLIVLSLMFFWLAGVAIKKDMELVESMDRIR
ncbi:MAG: DUF4293 family protein [Balneolaceae bacterium]